MEEDVAILAQGPSNGPGAPRSVLQASNTAPQVWGAPAEPPSPSCGPPLGGFNHLESRGPLAEPPGFALLPDLPGCSGL